MVHIAIAKPFDQKRIELVHLYKKRETPNKSSTKELEDANIEIADQCASIPISHLRKQKFWHPIHSSHCWDSLPLNATILFFFSRLYSDIRVPLHMYKRKKLQATTYVPNPAYYFFLRYSYKREEENGRDFEKKRKSWAPPFSSRAISFLRLFAGKSRKWEWQKPLSFRLLFPLLPPSLSPFLLGMGLKRRRRQREGEKISSKQTPFETHFRTFTSFSLSFPQNGRAKLF